MRLGLPLAMRSDDIVKKSTITIYEGPMGRNLLLAERPAHMVKYTAFIYAAQADECMSE